MAAGGQNWRAYAPAECTSCVLVHATRCRFGVPRVLAHVAGRHFSVSRVLVHAFCLAL